MIYNPNNQFDENPLVHNPNYLILYHHTSYYTMLKMSICSLDVFGRFCGRKTRVFCWRIEIIIIVIDININNNNSYCYKKLLYIC
jgi:hypothetical protein